MNRQHHPAVEDRINEALFRDWTYDLYGDLQDAMGPEAYATWAADIDFDSQTWYQIYWLLKNKLEEVKAGVAA